MKIILKKSHSRIEASLQSLHRLGLLGDIAHEKPRGEPRETAAPAAAAAAVPVVVVGSI